MSLEASDALDKIESTFSAIEKSVSTMKKRSEPIVHTPAFDPTILSKSIDEMKAKIIALELVIDKNRVDIDSNRKSLSIPQETIQKAVGNNLSVIEGNVQSFKQVF